VAAQIVTNPRSLHDALPIFDRVSKGYAAVGPLLADVSLGLGDSERVGVVGLNGAGKSTLLRLLSRAEEPDAGRVTHRRGLRVLTDRKSTRLNSSHVKIPYAV